VVNAKTGTFRVTLKVDNADGVMKSGMFAQVNIKYNTHQDALLIPRKAVISMDNKHTVYAVTNGIVDKHEITVGYQEGAYVEVLAGLAPQSQVVTAGHNNLKDKANVQIITSI
jgi:RND family efflux transporter MFP subunit